MNKTVSQKIPIIFGLIFILISGNTILVHSQTDDSTNLSLMLKISPSSVEAGDQSHKIGYVGFVSKYGSMVKISKDTTIQLESNNEAVASVPARVTIPAGSEFVSFDILTTNTAGSAKISALYNNEKAFDTIIVGASADFANDIRLVINLPTSEMNVNSEMPFSLYLQNSDGDITQAPFDISVSLDYESGLIGIAANDTTIKKGNSYVWGTIKSHDKVGNAFIRATSDNLGIDEAREIRISSSLPSSLSVNIFPEKIPATMKRDIDVIVSLVDSDGQPTLTPADIPLQFFSDDNSIGNQIDRGFKESQSKPVIKKGQFSYHFSQRLDFIKENKTITIGATTKGLGVASDTFSTVKPYTTSNPLAENKTMQLLTLSKIPTKSQTIAIFQIGMLLPKQVDPDESSQQTAEQVENEFYPLIINENYASDGSDKKINLISSNDLLLKIKEIGNIDVTSSYGTAIIESGQETGPVVLSSTIKGIGSASIPTEVINTLKQEKTMVFSPTGNTAILFDKNGYFDLFVLSLDMKNRPTIVENEVRYLLTPINEILTIEKNRTFSHVNFQGSMIQSEDQDTITIKTVPIGESADVGLEIQNTFVKEPTARLQFTMPFEKLNANEGKYVGVVQLLDFRDEPLTLSGDLRVKITPSLLGIIEVPDYVVVPSGKSFVEFPIETKGKADTITLDATSKGIVGASTEIKVESVVTKLKISIGSVIEPISADQPTDLKIYVDDEQENSVGGATIRIISDNSAVTPSIITTKEDGSAAIQFNAHDAPKTSLQILATAAGYTEEQKTFEFDVQPNTEVKQTELPEWLIYAGIGVVATVVVGLVIFLRKPKLQLEDEEYE
ncbi:MAG: hypothetical protein ACHQW9_01980 [Nitrososphaerales archaeon]